MSEATASMSVKLPSAVQRQLDNVKVIEDKMKENFNAPSPNGSQTVTNEPAQTVTPAVTPVATVEPTKVVDETKDARYWEHRFKTLEGMAKAEQMRLKTVNANLESRITELEEIVKNTKSQSTPTSDIDLKRYLSQEEIDAYGPDVMKAVVKATKAVVGEESDRRFKEELKRQIDPLKNKLLNAEAQIVSKAQDQFWSDLDRLCPNWLTINENVKFREWLSERDPLSGMFRQELLNHAQESLDVGRVVALFTAFEKSSPAPQPVVNKNTQVVPDPVATPSSVTSSNEVPFVTRQQIKQFYSDKAMGRYRSRPLEAEQMQKKIDAAIKAGNVR